LKPRREHCFLAFALLLWIALAPRLLAVEAWEAALERMPLGEGSASFGRDNCMELFLRAFRSNDTVKALIFLPGVADDFYLINRSKPKLHLRASNLREGVIALTNATAVRVSFRAPFLLLHTATDLLEPSVTIKSKTKAGQLKDRGSLPHAFYLDRHWDIVQPELERVLGLRVLPRSRSEDAWHFHRHYVAGWHLTDWELLQAVALASRTAFILHRTKAVFRVDARPYGTTRTR
jgi:hypothetical protein